MAQQQQWISLDSCIYDYINAAELSQHKYFKLFHLAFTCMEDLGLDFFYQVKSIKVPVNSNQTVTLPADFLSYNKLGILNGNGELVPLKYNENLTTFGDLREDRMTRTDSSNFADYYSFSSPVFFNYWDGGSYSNLYGVSGGGSVYGGGFKIDNANGVILLDASFGWSDLVLEYTASPQEGQEYRIPVQFRLAMIAWLSWQDVANLPMKRGTAGVIGMRRHEYFEARRRAISQYRPFYLDQAYIQNLATSRLVVKP